MSVREKEDQKSACPNRGLGIAAAAIGVGVGAALYYFFNKQTETPSTEGSSSNWTNERPDALTEEQQMAIIRQQALEEEENKLKACRQPAFRERSWTLEECSICFDVMLRNQDVTSLPCAHNFHTDCIMPWLQERQTCPNCRKAAE